MSNMIQAAREQVAALTQAAYEKAAAEGLLPAGAEVKATIEIPKDVTHGDYASSFAMAGAKALRKAPRQIAEVIVSHLDLAGTFFDKVEIAGPGFLNFTLGSKWYGGVLADIQAEGETYGAVDEGRGEKVMVEFVSANPTGPMHIGNARGGVLGDALAAVLERAGYDVWREFYVNDAGNQIAISSWCWGRRTSPSPRTATTATTSRSWPGASTTSTAPAGRTRARRSGRRPWPSTACPSTSPR